MYVSKIKTLAQAKRNKSFNDLKVSFAINPDLKFIQSFQFILKQILQAILQYNALSAFFSFYSWVRNDRVI